VHRVRASSSWSHAAPARAHGVRPPFPMPMWWITDRAEKRPIRQLFTIVPIHPGRTKRLLVASSILHLELRIRILNLIVLMCLFDTQGYTVFITSNCNY
jgi:hypothetical protein